LEEEEALGLTVAGQENMFWLAMLSKDQNIGEIKMLFRLA
jgi:hypothetical protein